MVNHYLHFHQFEENYLISMCREIKFAFTLGTIGRLFFSTCQLPNNQNGESILVINAQPIAQAYY